ncbi:MAG: hypothetical protein VYA54_05300 [Bdellovibrionota bacterium]|nr:hypothetical protein [Bdellovibrionota bacterium]
MKVMTTLVLSTLFFTGCLDKRLKSAKDYKKKAIQSEAKLLALATYTSIISGDGFIDRGVYSFSDVQVGESASNIYKVLDPTSEESKKLCSDCKVNKEGFKILVAGNLDEDEDLDLWTIDDQKNLVNIKSDVE